MTMDATSERFVPDDEALTEVTADRGYFCVGSIEREGEGMELLMASGRGNRPGKEGRDSQCRYRRACTLYPAWADSCIRLTQTLPSPTILSGFAQ